MFIKAIFLVFLSMSILSCQHLKGSQAAVDPVCVEIDMSDMLHSNEMDSQLLMAVPKRLRQYTLDKLEQERLPTDLAESCSSSKNRLRIQLSALEGISEGKRKFFHLNATSTQVYRVKYSFELDNSGRMILKDKGIKKNASLDAVLESLAKSVADEVSDHF